MTFVRVLFIASLLQVAIGASLNSNEARQYKSGQVVINGQATEELRCGGVLTSSIDDWLGIEYHQFDPFLPNERCVWTVRAVNASSYTVEVIYLGFPESNDDHRLVVTGLYSEIIGNPTTPGFPEEVSQENEPITHIVVNSATTFNLTANVVVLTFQTGPSNPDRYRGFILTVTPHLGSGRQAFFGAQDFMASTGVGIIKYPLEGDYGSFDVSTFLFLPPNNTVTGGDEGRTDIVYIKSGMECCCFDYVLVFKFTLNSETPHKWEMVGALCEDVPMELISHSDILMLVFFSDVSGSGPGFQLSFTRCAENEEGPSTTPVIV